jgi:hypothetical protein
MYDPAKRVENLMKIDFRQNIFEYEPSVTHFSFILPPKMTSEKEIIIKLFYKENIASKIKWIAGIYKTLDLPVIGSCVTVREGVVFGKVVMMIENFPMHDFAKKFSINRVLEKNITSMKAYISTGSLIEIINPQFLSIFNRPLKGLLKIGSVEKETRKVVEDEFAVLPLLLQGPANN